MTEWGIISTVLIIAVLALRRCCQGKLPHRLIYGLWLVVLVRLLVPVTPVESSFSILNFLPRWEKQSFDEDVVKGNDKEIINEQLEKNVYLTDELVRTSVTANIGGKEEVLREPVETARISDTNVSNVSRDLRDFSTEDANNGGAPITKSAEKSTAAQAFLYRVWLAGVMAWAVFFAAVNLRFYFKIKKNAEYAGKYRKLRVYDTKEIVSPCLFGIIAPSVYIDGSRIPSEAVKEHILMHEATHFRHRDNLWAAFRAAAVILHWYNPIVWYAAFVSEKDCELACDESVIKALGEENRISYGETLLQMICQSRRTGNVMCTATTMIGTKRGIKERIRSVAFKTGFSKAAFVVLVVVVCFAAACTFTAKDSNAEEKALIKEAKEKLFENEIYNKTRNLKTASADYDNDGQKELFLFVKTEEDSVDVLYYDEGEVTAYRTESKFGDMDTGIDVLELAGKSFCVYDRVSDGKTTSRVLGIRDGKIINYFFDYQNIWLNEKSIDGKITAVNQNEVDVTTYNHVASIEGDYSKEQYCTMTEYFYYDKAEDSFRKYPVYEITREEFLAVDGGKEALEEFRGLFDKESSVITYAKCNGKMIIMGYASYEPLKIVRKHRVYEYEAKENRLGAILVSGDGMYENLDAGSRQTVSRHEQSKMNAVYQLIDEYEKMITVDGKILKFEEWWEDDCAYIRVWEWTKENELLAHIAELPFVYENKTAYYGQEDAKRTTYSRVADLETFQMLYTANGSDCVNIPDLFLYNIQAELADNHIKKYMEAESAFLGYFHVEGGRISDVQKKTDFGVETAKVTYEFADKKTVTVELYKDYQGIWAVAEGGFRDGYEANFLYAQLTDEDFRQAVPADEFSFAENYGSDTIRNVLIKEHIAAGVDVYYSPNHYSCGMIVKNGDEKTLLPVPCDLMNLPQFFTGDCDNDGVAEVFIINCTGRGTEFHTESISVIESAHKPYDRVYELDTDTVETLIDEKLHVIYNKENGRIRLALDTDNEASQVELSVGALIAELEKKGESNGLGSISYGNIGYMTYDGGSILCDMLLSYVPDGWVTGFTLPEAHSGYNTMPWEGIRVKLHYEGNGEIVFDDIFFITEEEFAYWW